MPAILEQSEKSAQLNRGCEALKAFQRQITQTTSRNEADDYRGDRVVFKSMCLPPAKRLAPALLQNNYFASYMNYIEYPGEQRTRETFMRSKLERNRFRQSAGVHGSRFHGEMLDSAPIPGQACGCKVGPGCQRV